MSKHANTGSDWVRPLVQRLRPYEPGEQSKEKGLVKLNTNENPYPPSDRVLKAMKAAVDDRLRLYPDPCCHSLKEALAGFHGVQSEQIIVGNGSDELLALATRAFVEPQSSRQGHVQKNRSVIQYFVPSYSLYPVLSEIHGAIRNEVPLTKDFAIPSARKLKSESRWNNGAALTYVTTPNAPTGRGYTSRELRSLCRGQQGVVILDEAYADFAEENAMSLASDFKNVLVSRTFSKSYALCFQRIGYFVGHPSLVRALDCVRDSYNVNGLGQVAALETLKSLSYYRKNITRIIKTRDTFALRLRSLGFDVLPSQANFLFVKPPGSVDAKTWFEGLRERKVLVRWFADSPHSDRLRITIGTRDNMRQCMNALQTLCSQFLCS
ncbi:histidinol-phosphate transaminase [bacterium]|nr:histidinol-phosphate transaminase [Verrucomicrobiota bacterium]MDC0267724.1 histidinol-phosphate transaminase [bacterium]